MTTAQLISELEKRGVLPIEEGDHVTLKKYNYKFIVAEIKNKQARGLRTSGWSDLNSLTHLADDPRLLGRVLRELATWDCCVVHMWESHLKDAEVNYRMGHDGMTRIFGRSLIQTLLLAWLGKVEGDNNE